MKVVQRIPVRIDGRHDAGGPAGDEGRSAQADGTRRAAAMLVIQLSSVCVLLRASFLHLRLDSCFYNIADEQRIGDTKPT